MQKICNRGILRTKFRTKKWQAMLVILLMAFSLPIEAFANGNNQQAKVSLNLKNASFRTLCGEMQKQTDLSFIFNVEQIEALNDISIKAKNESVENILQKVLAETGLTYKVQGDIIVICEAPAPISQEQTQQTLVLAGKVTDTNGEGIAGATVVLEGTTLGVATDPEGNFTLEVPRQESLVLEISFVGMKKQTLRVNTQTQPEPLSIVLEEDIINVDEVVVVGYGTTSTRDLTGQVASLNEEQLSRKSTTNVENLLQNAAAGVVVSQASSNPNEKIRVRVRGESSLTGDNEPLYVIDGIPVSSNIMSSISPQDIQSIDVLKDASAAAIYGSRGANGVIIITTKRGKSGKPTLNASYSYSVDADKNKIRPLEADEWREFVRYTAEQTLKVDPSNDMANAILEEGSEELLNGNTNWYEELKRLSFRHDVDLSLRGGNDKSSYYISLGITDYQGMTKHDDFTRYSGRINLDYDIAKFLRFGTSTTISYSDISEAATSLYTALGFRPDYPIYNEDGSYYKNGSTNNPIASNEQRIYDDKFNILSSSYLELDIWKGLKFKTALSINQSMSYSESYEPTYLTSDDEGYGYETNSRSFSTVFDNTLSYTGKFNGIHSIDAVVGLSFERTKTHSMGLYMTNYPMDEILTGITNATEYYNSSGSGTVYGLQSSFARINYRLMDRYLFTFTARYDGSSSFGANNRYGFFPSGAFAWRISDEPFMKNAGFVDDLKLKISAGKTGVQNFDLGSYANKDLYETSSYMNNPAIVHSQLGNRDIRWETTMQYDFGIDFTLFRSALSGSIAYYIKNTNDLIWSYTPPSSLAVGSVPTNVGAVRNKGIELTLRANLLRNQKDWNWELGLNASHNHNRITKLVEEGAIANGMGITVQGSGNQVLAEGYAMGVFFGYEYDGIIQDQATIDALNAAAVEAGFSTYDGSGLLPGHLQLRDVNGDGHISTDDRMIIGSPESDLIGGFTSNLTYKRWSLYLHFGFQIGGQKLYNKTLQNLPSQLSGLIDYNLYNRWTPDNTDATLPAMYIGDGSADLTDHQLHSASNLRLQQLRIAYDLPQLWGGKYLKSGELYFTANNLFVLTKYPGLDPSSIGSASSNYGSNYESWSFPAAATFTFGLNLNF